jgi:hypothetical protein
MGRINHTALVEGMSDGRTTCTEAEHLAEVFFFSVEPVPNHYLKALYVHKEKAGKSFLLWVLRRCRNSFVNSYVHNSQSCSCLKKVFKAGGNKQNMT